MTHMTLSPGLSFAGICNSKDAALTHFMPAIIPANPGNHRLSAYQLRRRHSYYLSRQFPHIATTRTLFTPHSNGITQSPLLPASWGWHPETRVATGDPMGTGHTGIIITESEIPNARLAVLYQQANGEWAPHLIADTTAQLNALHSLICTDVDNDGIDEIIVIEMENSKTNNTKPPRWLLYDYLNNHWNQHTLLDQNIGGHCAVFRVFHKLGTRNREPTNL